MGNQNGLPTLNPKVTKEDQEILECLSEIDGHGRCKIITITNGDDFIKKFSDRSRKEPRPEWLNNLKKLTMQVVNIGHGYEKMVKNQLGKLGLDPNDFNSEKCKYSKRFTENGIVRQNNNEEMKFYMRYFVGVMENSPYEEVFVNEQGDVVAIDKANKDKWFNGRGKSLKQEDAGVVIEIKPRNVKLENLFYFQFGDKIVNRLTPEIMELLDLEEV